MIDAIDTACRTWASQKRRMMLGNDGWPPRSMLGKLIEEGPGAHQAGPGFTHYPEGFSGEGLEVSRALRRMAETQQMEKPWVVVHAHYLYPGRAKSKAPLIGVSVPTYWSQLHAAHAFIAALLSVPRETIPSRQGGAAA